MRGGEKLEGKEAELMGRYGKFGTAVITPKGIKFLDSYYSCSRAISEQWFELASKQEGRSVDVYFSPIDLSRILIRTSDSNDYETCDVIVPQSSNGSKLENYFKSIQKLKNSLERMK